MRGAGKLIRQSLKTDVFSIAKLRLADLEKMNVSQWKLVTPRATVE
jgi:hypothetical protein